MEKMFKIKHFMRISSGPARGALFLSGTGSNAERLLSELEKASAPSWCAAAIVTDNPLGSRAGEIAKKFSLPLVALDIREFYRARGEQRISLASERGREIREEWTNELRSLLRPHKPDFGILAGFVPLTNITGDFPCLNVHPGDLTVEKDGRRLLVGLNTIPVEAAILGDFPSLRSSVIIARPYSGGGSEMDSGHIIGLSPQVPLELDGFSLESLRELAAKRPAKKPAGGYKDRLEQIAMANQELLKQNGDWLVFPPAVSDFAAGNFAEDESGRLLYRQNNDWLPVKTVVYGDGAPKPMPL